MAVKIAGDGEKRTAFQRTVAELTLMPTTRAAVFYPNGRKLPFFDMRGVPVKYEARIPGARMTPAITTDTLEVAVGMVAEDIEEYEKIEIEARPRQKAYASITIAGSPKVTLFDMGSQGDLMSTQFYKERCSASPLRVARTTVQGVNKAVTRPDGSATMKLSIADRRVMLAFLVLNGITDDVIIGHTMMAAMGIDIINSEGRIAVSSRKHAGTKSYLPILGNDEKRTTRQARSLHAAGSFEPRKK